MKKLIFLNAEMNISFSQYYISPFYSGSGAYFKENSFYCGCLGQLVTGEKQRLNPKEPADKVFAFYWKESLIKKPEDNLSDEILTQNLMPR